jgi:2-polyprenyl-3-methyl-5-hydroxy-6-metoxy-1,4-benzoquinol methylase
LKTEIDYKLKLILEKYRDPIRETMGSSYTLTALWNGAESLAHVLRYLSRYPIETMLDLGCGYGILSAIIAEYLGVRRLYLVDIDEDRLSYVRETIVGELKTAGVNIEVYREDICRLERPVDVDLMTSFGVLEHVSRWDELLEYVRKALKLGGFLMISMPNLSSWLNRVALLIGYQPRDLEISSRKLYGVLSYYHSHLPAGHIKLASFKAFKEFLEDNGFQVLVAQSLYSKENLIVNIIDRLLDSPSLGRRFVILARRLR